MDTNAQVDEDESPEDEFIEFLEEALFNQGESEGQAIATKPFDRAGLLTSNKGLVVKYKGKKYQLTVVAE